MDRKFWKSRFKRVAACVMAFSMTVATAGFTVGALSALQGCSDKGQSQETSESYNFTYDLNYAGSTNRTISVGAGKKVNTYNASRFGYVLDGWFCEKECTTPYNFSNPVNQDTTIYALWTDKSTIVYHNVTFDYGEGLITSEEIRDGKVVPSSSVMSSQKLGYDIVGWYLDEAFTQKFAFGVTPVTSDLTLYAKYVQKDDVTYTDDDDYVFENVEISIAFKDYHQTSTKKWVQTLVNEFNEIYDGEISISVVDEKEKPTLWFDSTSKLNAKKSEIYSMEDALAVVGKDFDEEQYYENWINDCYIDGELFSMPIASFVPVIGYNRSLMNEYNGGVVPTDHTSLMQLLQKVHEAKNGTEGWVSTISLSNSDDMKEIVSNNFYVQNNLPLYSLNDEGKLANQWLKEETTKTRALDASNWFIDTFVKYGSVGKIWGTAWQTGKKGPDWSYVGAGQSFMGVMGNPNLNSIFGWRTNQTEKTLWTKTVGIMPISYLFATEGDEETSQRIFVQNYSLAIPKYGNSDINKVAAAAVFADFASKYCEDACESYLYPANKLAQYNAFNKLTRPWCVDYILAECGDPNNFYTYPGTTYEYSVTVTQQISFLTNKLFWVNDLADPEVVSAAVTAEIEALCNNINKEMGA